jgi:TolB-like protein/DNA-binding SARP family transcriptional activator
MVPTARKADAFLREIAFVKLRPTQGGICPMDEAPHIPEPAAVHIRLLGGFAVTITGESGSVARIRSRKGCGLIAYLAMHSESRASRERLADLLWGDRFDDRARQNLRQCLVTVRTELEKRGANVFVLDHDTVGIRPELVTVDARDFITLAGSADLRDQERAINLYRGEFLADFTLGVDAFDDWSRGERARLAAAASRLLQLLAERADQLCMSEAAMDAVGRLVAIDPLREDWQRLALRLYARHRGRQAALAYARHLTKHLTSELGADPEPATVALIEGIHQGTIVPASAIAVQTWQIENKSPPTARQELSIRGGEEESGPSSDLRTEDLGLGLFRRVVVRLSPKLAVAILTALAAVIVCGAIALRALTYNWTPSLALDSAALAAKGLHSVVVMPFTTGAGDNQSDQALTDQITDDLINDLTRGGALQVVSRATTHLYRGRPIDVAAIGSELGARYVVVGSIRSAGSRIEVSIELVEASTRIQVWATRIEREKSEREAAINDIAWGITRQLHIEVVMAEDRRPSSGNSPTPEIGELLAKGWSVVFRHNVTGTTAPAEEYFTNVLQRDPENLSATIGLAAHYVVSVSNLYVPNREPYLSRADALLAKAIDRNPRSSQAYYFLGILQKTRGESDAALRSFTVALDLSPSNAPAAGQIGSTLALLGRADEAMPFIQRAIRLSPQDPALGRWDMFGGQIEIELGHDAEAIEWLLDAIALNPRNVRARALLGAAYALVGNKTEAIRQVAEIKRLAAWALYPTDRVFNDGSESRSNRHIPRYIEGWRMAVAAASQ